MKIAGTGVGTFRTAIAGGGTANTVLIPARYSSVRYCITLLRNGIKSTQNTKNSVGDRNRVGMTSFVYTLHGRNYPNLPVTCDAYTSAEALVKLMK
jgi:hypothetical protein